MPTPLKPSTDIPILPGKGQAQFFYPDTQTLTLPWIYFFEKLLRVLAGLTGGTAGRRCIGWDVQDSTPGGDVSDPVIPIEAIVVGSCRVRIKVTDATNPLEIDIRVNGASIFATTPTIAAGTTTRAAQVFTGFASDTLTIQPDDDVVLDIAQGGDWEVAIYLVAK